MTNPLLSSSSKDSSTLNRHYRPETEKEPRLPRIQTLQEIPISKRLMHSSMLTDLSTRMSCPANVSKMFVPKLTQTLGTQIASRNPRISHSIANFLNLVIPHSLVPLLPVILSLFSRRLATRRRRETNRSSRDLARQESKGEGDNACRGGRRSEED